jgi:hypothetical protein
MISTIIPGPCVMCGECWPLRALPDGEVSDGICERCDEIRFMALQPRAEWVSWQVKRERAATKLRDRPQARFPTDGVPTTPLRVPARVS